MRTVLGLLLALAACRSAPPTPAGGMTSGASSPEAAVENFLGAVRAGDLQAISLVWGTEKGPALSQIERTELERRALIMACFFNHDRARVLDQFPGEGKQRWFRVELKKGNLTRAPLIKTVPGPSDRWYVVDAEIEAVKDFCRNPPPSGR